MNTDDDAILGDDGLGVTVASMGRPPKDDRDAVAGETLTIRLTAAERAALNALQEHRQAELEGTGAVVTIAGIVRSLIVREARAVLGDDADKPSKRAGKARKPRKG